MTPVELLRVIAVFSMYSLSGLLLPFIVLLWFVNYGRLLLWFYRFVTPFFTLAMIWYSVHYTLSHLSLHASTQANFASLWWTSAICMACLILWGLTTFFHVGPPQWFLFLAELQLQTTLKRRIERGYGIEWVQTYRRRVEERREWAAQALHLSFRGAKSSESSKRINGKANRRGQPERWDIHRMEQLIRNNSQRNAERHANEMREQERQNPPANEDFRNGRVAWTPLGKQYRANPNALNQIFGMDHVINEVLDSIHMIVNNMNLVREYDAAVTAGIVMYGPPGTGKTELARAVAEQLGLYFISVRPSDLMGTLVGATQQNIASLFREAREHAPSIIFFDELDAIGAKRGSSHMYHDQTLTQLLMELDGFDRRDRVFVMAATNRLEMLDDALIRDGRFGTKVYVPAPNLDAIKEMWRIWASVLDFADNVYPLEIVLKLEGQTGATIKGFIERLKRIAIRKRSQGDRQALITREEVFAELERLSVHV